MQSQKVTDSLDEEGFLKRSSEQFFILRGQLPALFFVNSQSVCSMSLWMDLCSGL